MKSRKMSAGAIVLTVLSAVVIPISTTQAAQITTLTYSGPSTGNSAIISAFAAFEKANPSIKIKPVFAGTEQWQITLRTQLASGTAPDIFFVQPGNGNPTTMRQLAPPGYLKDLSGFAFSKLVPKGEDPVTSIDGKRYFLPTTIAGIGAIYNQNAVTEAKAVLPKTWSGVLAFCDAAKASGKVGFALAAQTLWVTQLINYALVPSLVFRVDPTFDTKLGKNQASFAGSAGWKSAFSKYQEMLKHGCFQADPLGTSLDVADAMVAKGDALAVVQVTPLFPAIAGAAAAGTTFGMFALPATENPAETWMPAAVGGGYGINAKTKNLAAATKFINFMASEKVAAQFAKDSGGFPAMPNSIFQVDPSLEFMNKLIKAGKTYPFMDQMWPNAKVQPAQYNGIQAMLGGTGSIADLLSGMDDAAQSK
jgi:raffinose/stachyose/melibiose transport system substrate-binding protein